MTCRSDVQPWHGSKITIRRLEEEFSLQVKTWSIRIMKSVSYKTAMVLVAVMVMVLTVPTRARDEQYTSKYDDMDVDHIMKSDRLTDSYVNCLLDQGPCTPEGKVMKISVNAILYLQHKTRNVLTVVVCLVTSEYVRDVSTQHRTCVGSDRRPRHASRIKLM
uniref:Uncharacterized protein n=1 Tax=Timema tahoe TaxID=61484 RepID=A0A7R9IHG2_9NEOP|nr:unnamed protein product [Timema tahoe]